MAKDEEMNKGNKKVKIYSTPACTYCKQAKEFFKEEGVEYEDIDVSENKKAAEEMAEKSGQMGVPVIIIESHEKPIIGFNRNELEEALAK